VLGTVVVCRRGSGGKVGGFRGGRVEGGMGVEVIMGARSGGEWKGGGRVKGWVVG